MSSSRSDHDAPPPVPLSVMPPLPPGPPPSYKSHGDAWRPPQGPQYSLPRSDFSFRAQDTIPRHPRKQDTYRSTQSKDRPTNGNRYRGAKDLRRGERPFRGRGQKTMPSDRPLLQKREGGVGEEQMLGVDTEMQKFIPIEDISESDGDELDVPNEGQDEIGRNREDRVDQGPPLKRRALNSDGATDGDSVPQWSNPDPYSVLPPIDELQRKRKDPVAFIRKGFKPAEEKAVRQNQVAANDDFISFEDGGTESIASSSRPHSESRPSLNNIVVDNGDQPQSIDLTVEINAVLGSRKRTYDDEIKQGGQAKKGSSTYPSGSLLEAWIPRTVSEATPWLNKETSSIISPSFRLHRELCDFYEFVKPRPYEQAVRQALFHRLQALIAKEMPDCTAHCFGSFAAGLFLPNADMDIVVNSNSFNSTGRGLICQSKAKLFKFGQFIRDSRIAQQDSVEVIASAKVPIIKFVDCITAIKVDVSFENHTGLSANENFSAWKRQHPAAPILVAVIKQFLMMRGLNEVQFGGLGGFSVTCLVVSLLQNMPRVQSGFLVPEENLGETLLEFLDFYGNRIDTSRTGIMMNPPGYFDKQAMDRLNLRGPVYHPNKADRLAIIDPNRPGNDISGGSKNVALIFDRFAQAHTEILEAMKAPYRPVLLDWLLAGNYESFAWYRARLLEISKSPSPKYDSFLVSQSKFMERHPAVYAVPME